MARWDPGNCEAELWFRAAISSSADTGFILYYDGDYADNSDVKSPGDATSIWPTSSGERYVGVYHLSEGSGVMIDSTSNGNDGTVGDLEARRVSGASGGYAASFQPVDYVSLGDLNLEGYTDLTILAVARAELVTQSGTLVGCWPSTDQLLLYARDQTPDRWRYILYDSGGSLRDSGTGNAAMNVATDSWITLAGVFDGGVSFKTYLDHDETYSTGTVGSGIRSPSPTGTAVTVGGADNDGDGVVNDMGFDGCIDCVIIANGCFSQSLIDIFAYGFEDDLINWGTSLSSATYAYDLTGNRVSSSWNGTTTTWVYDARGRVTEERLTRVNGTAVSYPTGYEYDGVGRVTEMTYPDGFGLDMKYDDLNRLRRAVGFATFNYTVDNRLLTVGYDNGVTTSYAYDSRGRPTGILVERPAELFGDGFESNSFSAWTGS